MKIMSSALFRDVKLIETKIYQDQRGFFTESYNKDLFLKHDIPFNFVQDNLSLSLEAGVLRGLHYQMNPKAQAKLVRVFKGAIYDVVVDIRQGSPTFGKWESYILSESNHLQLLVPQGFAHGFCTIVDHTQVLYKVDEYYSPEHDKGILWKDPTLGITWPTYNPILSEKDEKHPLLVDAENNYMYGEES